MPETINETYHPMAFDAIKIGLASPEKDPLLDTQNSGAC